MICPYAAVIKQKFISVFFENIVPLPKSHVSGIGNSKCVAFLRIQSLLAKLLSMGLLMQSW